MSLEKRPTESPAPPPAAPVALPPAAPVAPPTTPVEPAATPTSDARPGLPARLCDLFRLLPTETRLLARLLHSDQPIAVSTLAADLHLPVADLLPLLAPEGALRGRALIEVSEGAQLGWALPHDTLHAARGLHQYTLPGGGADDVSLITTALPGVTYLPALPPDTAWAADLIADRPHERALEKPPAAIVDLVRDHLVSAQPVVLSLGGLLADQVWPLCHAARLRLQRPVVVLDGSAVGDLPALSLGAALRRLRRDVDARGAALIVTHAASLRGSVRSLLFAKPASQTAPVVLCSDGPPIALGRMPDGPRGEPPFVVASLSLRPPAVAPAAAPAHAAPATGHAGNSAAATGADAEDPAVVASREEARRLAAIDAARAMGRPVPRELMEPVRTPVAIAAAPASPTAVAPATPAAPATTYRPPAPNPAAVEPAPVERAAPPASSEPAKARPVNPRLAAALAAAGLPPAGSAQYRSGEHARPAPAAPAAAPAPTPPPAAPEPQSPAAPSDAAVAPAAAASAIATAPDSQPATSDSDVESGPPIPLDPEAPTDEVMRVARTTTNLPQRIELMRRLFGTRHPAVIHLYRTNLTSAHPTVRETAEQGMSSLFGPGWNRGRQIAPPVQPPRSDDGGRGPGGAF